MERFALIEPARVILRGRADTPILRSVTIIPDEKYPFRIVEAKAKNGRNIRFSLSETTGAERPGYLLQIENVKTGKGQYYDLIALKTDSSVKPEIQIGVYGQIQDKLPSTTVE